MSLHIPPEGMTFDDLELSVRLRDVLKRMPYNMATLLTHTPYTLWMMLRERREQAYYARRQVITINELEGMEQEALEDLEAIRGALEKKGLQLYDDDPRHRTCKGCLKRLEPTAQVRDIRFLCRNCERTVMASPEYQEHMDVLTDRLLEEGRFKKK